MAQTNLYPGLCRVLQRRPDAWAVLRGSEEYPRISGTVRFFQTRHGVLVAAEIAGLPEEEGRCESGIFALHIHSGGACAGNRKDPFADAGAHYNPENCPHPEHSGDLPPLFSNHGRAFQVFLTDRFTAREIVGRTVIVHARPDDFTTQPAGNAGKKMACGVIRGNRCR